METMTMTSEERKDFENLETRTMALEFTRAEGEDDRRVSVSFASEEPVMRSFGWEVLSHEREDIDLEFFESGRAPLLLNHNPEVQIGVIERANLDETTRKSRAGVRFGKSELASEILQDVNDKIRTNISVGYQVTNLLKTDEQRDGVDVFRAIWNPLEISGVSIPADRGDIGVGRAESKQPIIEEKSNMETKTEIVAETPSIDADKVKQDALAERAKEIKEMQALGVRHNLRDFADECIHNGTDLFSFREKMLNKIESKPLTQIEDPIDIKPKEAKRYSFLKALNAASRGDWSGAGFESEMSQEMSHKSGKSPQGFFVPDYAWRSDLYTAKRELTVGTDGTGGFFAPSQQLGSEWIGALRAKMVLSELGMRTMSGLTTKVQIPKIAAATAGFVAESGDVSDNTHVTTQITMQARTLGARTTVSRLLLLESDPSIEQIVRDDLVSAIASKIQDVMIEGGGSNEPTGVTKTSGVGAVTVGDNGGAPTWALITNLVREVEVDNAVLNDGTLGFATNPKLKSKMAQTAKVGSSDSVMLLNDPWSSLYGYPIRFSTDVPSNLTKGTTSGTCSALIFGDWSQLLMGSWGNSPDILVDPYGNNDGGVKIIVFSEIDAAVRHAQSFAITVDYVTT